MSDKFKTPDLDEGPGEIIRESCEQLRLGIEERDARIASLERIIFALCEARHEVHVFALQMENALQRRAALQRRTQSGMPNVYLLQQMRLETHALQQQCDLLELESQLSSPAQLLEHAVNVALAAMWIADNQGALV
jgi:hypothetical protein